MPNRLNIPDDLNFLIEKRTQGERRKQPAEGESSDGQTTESSSTDDISVPDRRKRQRRSEPDTSQ